MTGSALFLLTSAGYSNGFLGFAFASPESRHLVVRILKILATGLQPGEMLDGLGGVETAPRPLIMSCNS